MVNAREHLRSIQNFKDLVGYLETELDWPLQDYGFDELTFEYQPTELGLKDEDAVKVRAIHQLRPLQHDQPWGIFFVEFEKKKLPIVVLRRILSHLVVKKRASANKAQAAAWDAADLLFISAFGVEATDQREIAFAHFHQESGDLPTLRVLGWDGGDTPLKLDHVSATLKERLRWPDDPADRKAWREQWSRAFRHRLGHVIRTAEGLAETLAALARGIRDAAQTMMAHESDKGPLTKLYKAFQSALIHDLTEESFADTYAQTITYGLLTAAISRTEMSEGRHGTALIAENVADMVPITNPFLKEMLQAFLKVGGRKGGIDFDELGIQDVVELLRGEETDLPAILRDFGNKNPNEDPVIHFYEHFLGAYDKPQKKQRGVFYTPQPVVSYIVRSVHELLQTEFGLEDGLASTITWGEMLKKHPGLKLPKIHVIKPGKPEGEDEDLAPDEFFVMMLDPATGTATFLVEVIDVIHRTLRAKWKKQGLNENAQRIAWNEYVPKHLLPRLYGYELLMAPYAIAHMKIGLKLYETGYRFSSDERVRIYLTNSLEPPQDFSDRLAFDAPALAHEAQAVNAVKRHKRFTVVIGNPPYSGHSANDGAWVGQLLQEYYSVDGAPLGERNPKWLQDDYVKFIRLGQELMRRSDVGVFGFITNHGYIDNPTFRGMRQSLLRDFTRFHALDLHGNTKKEERSPDGSADGNVFDIQQGVAVFVATRKPHGEHISFHYDLFGTREVKYRALAVASVATLAWDQLAPSSPFYLLHPQNIDARAEYDAYVRITDVLPVNVLGFQTHRDHFAIDLTEAAMRERIGQFRSKEMSDAAVKERFEIKDADGWKVHEARTKLRADKNWKAHFTECLYRPFDTRWCYFNGVTMDRPRRELLDHVVHRENICLLVRRQIGVLPWQHVGVSRLVAESCVVSTKTKEQNYNFPLWTFPESDGLAFSTERRPNLSVTVLKRWAALTGLQASAPNGLPAGLTPEDIFHYTYAVFHSPGYRRRYAEFLKIDFPRLPLTGNLELFRALARLGGELVALHLLESPKLDRPITEFIGGRNPEVEKVSWSKDTVWVDKAQNTGFNGVRENLWNFHIGGYQVCEKWLKDRRGRTLTKDDIVHYQKIVVALSETIRVMKEIDEVIEKHGGWPAAFSAVSSTASDSVSVTTISAESEPAVIDYPEGEEPSPLAAEAELPFSGEHQLVKEQNGDSPSSPRQPKIEASRETEFDSIDDIDQYKIMAAIRQVFNDGVAREREIAMRDVARELGFDRTGSRIQERLNGELIAAGRRGIVANKSGEISIAARTIEDYAVTI